MMSHSQTLGIQIKIADVVRIRYKIKRKMCKKTLLFTGSYTHISSK
jgi:hypothetical protein